MKGLEAVLAKENREGWPLQTVETEVNGDSKRRNERGSFLVNSLSLSYRYKRFLLCCLDALVDPGQNLFFLALCTFVPIAQQGGQAAVLGRLSLSLCLWIQIQTFRVGSFYL